MGKQIQWIKGAQPNPALIVLMPLWLEMKMNERLDRNQGNRRIGASYINTSDTQSVRSVQ